MSIYAITALVFMGSFAMVFWLFYLLVPKKSFLQQRVEGLAPDVERPALFESPPTPWQEFLGNLGRKVPLRDTGKYTRMLVAAGIKGERLPVFIGAKVFLAALLPVLYLLFYGIPVEKNTQMAMLLTVALAITGFLLPSYWLHRKVGIRQMRIFHDLPDVLDLMTVCVEAGLSMDAAMVRISEDLQFKKSPLAAEMKVAAQETRAGKSRLDALRDMGERSMVDDLKSFAAMLIQTEKLGTSLVQSLRIHSDSLRVKRRQSAEEAAAKTSVKLIFPLVFFVFPALLVVILGPGVMRIFKVLLAE